MLGVLVFLLLLLPLLRPSAANGVLRLSPSYKSLNSSPTRGYQMGNAEMPGPLEAYKSKHSSDGTNL